MSIPINSFLSRKYKHRIEAEVTHPNLVANGKAQRKIDFVIRRPTGEGWLHAIEVKKLPLRGRPQDLVDDLLRLALMKKEGVDRYFLVAGELTGKDWKELREARKKAKGKLTNRMRVPFRVMINPGDGSGRVDLRGKFLRGDYSEKKLTWKNLNLRPKNILRVSNKDIHVVTSRKCM